LAGRKLQRFVWRFVAAGLSVLEAVESLEGQLHPLVGKKMEP
jgi:hypothetical protein